MPFSGQEDLEHIDERLLREVLQRTDRMERDVQAWSGAATDLLTADLPLKARERELIRLYIAEQRRRNLELDEASSDRNPPGLLYRLVRIFPLLRTAVDCTTSRLAHHLLSCHIEDDIERAVFNFSRECQLHELSDEVIDWRVSVRYLAQRLHAFAASREAGEAVVSRDEFMALAREQAGDIASKRQRLQPNSITARAQ